MEIDSHHHATRRRMSVRRIDLGALRGRPRRCRGLTHGGGQRGLLAAAIGVQRAEFHIDHYALVGRLRDRGIENVHNWANGDLWPALPAVGAATNISRAHPRACWGGAARPICVAGAGLRGKPGAPRRLPSRWSARIAPPFSDATPAEGMEPQNPSGPFAARARGQPPELRSCAGSTGAASPGAAGPCCRARAGQGPATGDS